MATPPSTALNTKVFCGFALTVAASAHAQISHMGKAINKAGRQRMLPQRMGKAWFGLGQGIQAQ